MRPSCTPSALPTRLLLRLLALQSHHHGLQREACWVLSNVAGTPGRGGIEALKGVNAVPVRGRYGACTMYGACTLQAGGEL